MKRIRLIVIIFALLMIGTYGFNTIVQKHHADNSSAKILGGKATKEKVEALLSKMSLEEKAGQMLQGARDFVTNDDMRNLGLGSLLSGGGSFPGSNTINEWKSMINAYQENALKAKNKIPIFYGVDAVHGLALVKGAVVYPHNIGLGAANDPDLMYKMGAAVAEEMKLAKISCNFSPCVAINGDPRWGRTYECYSSDTNIVTKLAKAYLKGQTDHGVIATVKHYVGDGSVRFGTGELGNLIDRGDVAKTEQELRKKELIPYKELVNSGAKMVMVSYSSINGVKMHENKHLITDVLKNEYGFKGIVISDWEAINGLSGKTLEKNVALAVNAGVDMLMQPQNCKNTIKVIVDSVNNGVIPMERVNDAVTRILTVKYAMGLFDDPYMDNKKQEVTDLGSAKYREIAKKLVEKSLVLLKNDNKTLPIKKGQKVFVVGPAINDMGLQCGGWGLTWQGLMDSGSKVTQGTTILEGLQKYSQNYGFQIITDKQKAKEADIVILAIGEVPYAEMQGDTKDLSITGKLGHPSNKEAIDFANSLNKPVVTLIVAGRNVLPDNYLKDWDSVVMCYLPGTEGDGIASVLTGETSFTGKLPMPYYKSVNDIGNKNADLLFEKGYGLK